MPKTSAHTYERVQKWLSRNRRSSRPQFPYSSLVCDDPHNIIHYIREGKERKRSAAAISRGRALCVSKGSLRQYTAKGPLRHNSAAIFKATHRSKGLARYLFTFGHSERHFAARTRWRAVYRRGSFESAGGSDRLELCHDRNQNRKNIINSGCFLAGMLAEDGRSFRRCSLGGNEARKMLRQTDCVMAKWK